MQTRTLIDFNVLGNSFHTLCLIYVALLQYLEFGTLKERPSGILPILTCVGSYNNDGLCVCIRFGTNGVTINGVIICMEMQTLLN